MVRNKLINSTDEINGTFESKHKFLMVVYFEQSNKFLYQAFQDYPNGEYIDMFRETGAVIKIMPINKN